MLKVKQVLLKLHLLGRKMTETFISNAKQVNAVVLVMKIVI